MSMTHLVSYADTDAGGVLHHARYIELAERGYLAWMKRRNLSFRLLGVRHNVTLVILDITARYRSAVQFEEEVQIITRLQAIDRKGLDWKTLLMRGNQVSFSMLSKMACVDNATKTIVSVPDVLVATLLREVESGARTFKPMGDARRVAVQRAAIVVPLVVPVTSDEP